MNAMRPVPPAPFWIAPLLCLVLSACGPKIGSEEWCAALEERPLVDWTAEEVKAYSFACIGRAPARHP